MQPTDEGSPEGAPKTTAISWSEYYLALEERYPKVSKPILIALHILMQRPDIPLLDAKAQAAVHGVRITAASVSAARRLLKRQTPATDATTASKPQSKRRREVASVFMTPPSGFDIEKLLRGTIESIRADAQIDAERLRAAIRRSLELLNAALAATND